MTTYKGITLPRDIANPLSVYRKVGSGPLKIRVQNPDYDTSSNYTAASLLKDNTLLSEAIKLYGPKETIAKYARRVQSGAFRPVTTQEQSRYDALILRRDALVARENKRLESYRLNLARQQIAQANRWLKMHAKQIEADTADLREKGE